jgi:gamma-glutamylcysteine synthetase
MIGNLSRTIVSKSIKFDLSRNDTIELLSDVFGSIEYDTDDLDYAKYILDTANYMLTQRDGIYDGNSHEQIRKFIERFV